VDFDFHTQVLPHGRRPVCRFNVVAAQAALGLSVVKTVLTPNIPVAIGFDALRSFE
jgi:hypothetical protein